MIFFFPGGSSEIEFLIDLFLIVYEGVCAPVNADAHEVQKRSLDSLGLVLQVVVSHLMCVLGTKLQT